MYNSPKLDPCVSVSRCFRVGSRALRCPYCHGMTTVRTDSPPNANHSLLLAACERTGPRILRSCASAQGIGRRALTLCKLNGTVRLESIGNLPDQDFDQLKSQASVDSAGGS